MDWKKVSIPEVPVSRLKVQTSQMSTLEYHQLLAIARLRGSNLSQLLREAARLYISEEWEETEKTLGIEAAIKGVTPEELFSELVR